MSPELALSFVRDHGVVLVSAKGPAPRMTEVIAGEPIRGSWWAHPKSDAIYGVLQGLAESSDILSCRLVGGKMTLVHRRLWPPLIRAAGLFPLEHLAKTDQEHTAAGHHVRRYVPFPDWADPESLAMAQALGEDEALDALGSWARSHNASE